MVANQKESYKTNQNLLQEFYHSCFGKIIILLLMMALLLFVALITRPTKQQMLDEMEDNIRECLQENDSIKADGVDDVVNNFCNIFTTAGELASDSDVVAAYKKFNRLEVYQHPFYSTAHIINNIHPSGVRVGIGVFGVVIPTVSYKDLILFVSPIKNYNKTHIVTPPVITDDDLGENPNVQEYHYLGDPDQ